MVCYYYSSMFLALAAASLAITTAATDPADSPADYLNLHNAARAAAGVGPVKWDLMAAAYARSYAGECRLTRSGGPYGENLYAGNATTTVADAVKAWTDEKRYYDSAAGTCAAGKACGSYVQVVWSSSTAIGCARVVCDGDVGGVFVVCSYSPPANVLPQDCCF